MIQWNEITGHPDQKFGTYTYSQCGEDLMILNLFDMIGIKNPSYLDLGAHEPLTISNTALLYNRGSRGVNVEANPNLIAAFHQHRPFDTNVNVGVALKPGTMKFYMWDDHSGRNTFNKEWADKLEKLEGSIDLEVTTIDIIVQLYCDGKYPDFLSIDIEGLDYDVLKQADFSKSSPRIICAEVPRQEDQKFCDMMHNKGYYKYSRHAVNVIFVREEYRNLVT